MKNIIKSLVIVVAVAAVAGMATWSYFSATGKVAGNTVAAGTLLLDVNKGAGKPVSISNIAPGYTDSNYRWFDAYNKGTLAGELFMRFVKTSGDDNLFNSLRIQLRDGGFTGACDGPIFYEGLIKDFGIQKISQHNVHAYVADATTDDVKDNIRPDYTMRVCQKISLPETGINQNNLQGKTVVFDEQISDMQDAKPDLTPVWP